MSEPTVPPPPPPPAPPVAPAGGDKTLMLVLAYLFPLSLVPLLTDKDDANVQWHAKHGIVLGLFFTVIWVLYWIVLNIPFVGCMTIFLAPFIALGWLIVTVIAIVKATKGERLNIPGISEFANKF
jgi:uncharacterized membrane protein